MFLKIFLSFWLIVGLFAAAQEVVARLAHNEEQRTIATVRGIADEGRTIVAAYEQRGATGAAEAVEAFEHRKGLFADLLDANRTSVIGRPVRPVEMELARTADRMAAAGRAEAAFSIPAGLAAQHVATSTGARMTVMVGLPRSTATLISRLFLFSSVRFAIILLIGGLVCLVVARHLTRPIVDLSQAANALAEGRLHTRVGAAAGKRRDETGRLACDFDRMAERIE